MNCGFTFSVPLFISILAREGKLINFYGDVGALPASEFYSKSLVGITISQGGRSDSYGCKDWLMKILEKFFEEVDVALSKDEEAKMGVMKLDRSKSSQGSSGFGNRFMRVSTSPVNVFSVL